MKYSELVDNIHRYMSVEELDRWASKEKRHCIDDSIAYIRIGDFGLVLVNKLVDFFIIDLYVSEMVPSDWIYKDWLVFCLEMGEIGFKIEASCLSLNSGFSSERIYSGVRVL